MTSLEGSSRLIAALERRSDIELRFECGKSIRAHSQKLSLASSVLGDLIDAVMDELITAMKAAKRKRDDEGTSDGAQTLPHIKVQTLSSLCLSRKYALSGCLMYSHVSWYSRFHAGGWKVRGLDGGAEAHLLWW